MKKGLQKFGVKYSFKCLDGVDVIEIFVAGNKINIVPLYLRGCSWSQDFEIVKECFEQNDFNNPIVIGDLNVRIGELQVEIDSMLQSDIIGGKEKRNSQDKVVNRSGKQLMEFCENNGLVVLNGMSKSDNVGKFTFVSGVGESVNDICMLSRDLAKYALDFSVDDKIWSDHMPITLTLQLLLNCTVNRKKEMLPKLHWESAQVELYNRRLEVEMRKKKNVKDTLILQDFIDIIRSAAVCKRKGKLLAKKSIWFDWKCLKARNMSLDLLRTWNKTQKTEDRKQYVISQKNYKLQCEISRKKYYDHLEEEINEINNCTDWWDFVKKLRAVNASTSSDIAPEIFKQYFEELLNHDSAPQQIEYVTILVKDHSLDKSITSEEVLQMLNKTKNGKAPGLDRIPYEFFKNADIQFIEELAKVYTTFYNSGQSDVTFQTSIIFPLFKKGDKNIASNYRGISFMNCIAKIMMGILNERLGNWLESKNIITEYQAGFRKNHSTVDNIYNLSSLIHIKFGEKKKVYAFFVDFKAAFDSVPRNLLIYKLHNLGISTKMVRFIENLYKSTNSVVWTGDAMSNEFEISTGVKQGCLLSPLLFSIYLNDLHDILGGGIDVGDINVRLLLYADDIVLLSDNVKELQKMINNLEAYCNNWNMQVNLAKSAIMVFRQGGRLAENEKWMFRGENIPVTTEYSYLGVKLTPKLSFKKHVENRNCLAKNSINATWRTFLTKNKIKLTAKWKLFLAVTRAIQSYAAQVWGFEMFEEVDKIQLYFLKRIFHLPTNTPSYCIFLETDTPNCHLYTLKLHLKYIFKTLFDYDPTRLPHKLSKIIIERNIFWSKAVQSLGRKLNIEWNFQNQNREEWNENINLLLQNLDKKNKQTLWERSLKGLRIYKELDHNIGKSYLNDNIDNYKIMWILKARCDLIQLGGRRNLNCTLCNLKELENLSHFLGRCPILKRIRYVYLKKLYLSHEEIINSLNGIGSFGWNCLVWYITDALKYRSLIVNEYC